MFNHVDNASRCMIIYPDRIGVSVEADFWISRLSGDLGTDVDRWFIVYESISYLGLVPNLGESLLSFGRCIPYASLVVIIFSYSATIPFVF